jgi:hypothetical protein
LEVKKKNSQALLHHASPMARQSQHRYMTSSASEFLRRTHIRGAFPSHVSVHTKLAILSETLKQFSKPFYSITPMIDKQRTKCQQKI